MPASDVQQRNLDGGGKQITFPTPAHAQSEAYGAGANASPHSTALGNSAAAGLTAGDTDSVAIGFNAAAQKGNAVAIGSSAITHTAQGVAVGRGANTNGLDATAVGDSAACTQADSVAVGGLAGATGSKTVAVGRSASAAADNATAVGDHAAAGALQTVAVGRSATAPGANSTTVGDSSTASAGGTAIGTAANAANGGIAIGRAAASANSKAAAVGSSATQPIDGFQVNGTVVTAPFGLSTFLATQDAAALAAIRAALGVDVTGIAFFINNGVIAARVCRLGPAGAVAGLPAGSQVLYVDAAGP
jgi:trimeric autotransporter adhesin